MGNETNTTQEQQFVFRRLEEALRFFGREIDARWVWIFVLGFVLAAGLAYVVWMYRRDAGAVGWPWAAFLAGLRSLVYLILAGVFLLPAVQTWERTETRSKVVLVPDGSASMGSKDDLPTEAVPVETLPTRQDKVLAFLADERIGFLQGLVQKNPVYVYRFGGRLDEEFRVLDADKALTTAEWASWLKPNPKEPIPDGLDDEGKARFAKRQDLLQQLTSGTNLPDALLEVVNREANNMVQGIVVVSDGRNTQFSAQAFEELRARARRAKIPIFAVAVGEHRQAVSIRLAPLQAPEQARPDDRFPVRVEIDGEGLANQDRHVALDITTPKGEKRTFEKDFRFGPGSGGPPHAQVEFDIDAAQLGAPPGPSGKPELEEGEWGFTARVPRDRREIFLPKEHVTDQAKVHVLKKPLRVLLFAGAPTHDFQFVRNLFVREVDKHRAELSIYLQVQRPGVVQDVPPERFLSQFPNRLGDDVGKPEERYLNLAEYDLILAFDPDWSQLQPAQLAALEKWVHLHAGGLVLVAGPVNTYQLARPANREALKPILDLFPVVLQDSRLQGLGMDRPTTEPWRLKFPGATADMEFLKLDESSKEPLAGWEEFFTGQPKADAGQPAPTIRGFYAYYPVESVKPNATVVATFDDPKAVLQEMGGAVTGSAVRQQPYLVTMPYGSGKVVYLGWGETWRLRQAHEVYHERFWTKLARYAGSGNLTRLSSRGVIVMGQEFTAGQVARIEAQLFGRDLQPLPPTATPAARLKPPAGVTLPSAEVKLQAKPSQAGEWGGWFQGSFRVPVGQQAAGEYRLELQIPDTGESLTRRFLVKEANPELDDTRPDFAMLYQLASEATEVLPRIKDRQEQDDLKRALGETAARLLQRVDDKGDEPARRGGRPGPAPAKEAAAEGKDVPHLFFDLSTARLIPHCLVADSKVQRSRGPVKDLWDEGFNLGDSSTRMAVVLLVVATLLSVEWLTRKLLKLA
jgi:hypothetical protein